jgi:uncharacterized membrane protein YraQ (UPF0718 family)
METLAQVFIGPVAAFFTFIGSMGNIPLAALLFSNGVSFAGVMAFIFSDLVVFPVLRVNAKFYGWKMSLYIAGIFLGAIVASAMAMHWAYAFLGMLPESAKRVSSGAPEFDIGFTFWMNAAFLAMTLVLGWLKWQDIKKSDKKKSHDSSSSWIEKTLGVLAVVSILWLIGGIAVYLS